MARRETVGQAYILMRADGRLLEGDIRRATQGAVQDGVDEWEKFDDRISKTERDSLQRFRNTMADAIATDDFAKFRKEFGSIDRTVQGVSDSLRRMRDQNTISAEQMERGISSVRQWAVDERRRMNMEARRSERDFQETSLRNTARYLARMQNLFAEARRTGNWAPLARRNEEAAETVRRVIFELQEYRTAMGMTRAEVDELSNQIRDWGAEMERAHDRSKASFDRFRQSYNETTLRQLQNSLARALGTDDWSRFRIEGESSRQTVERLSRSLERLAPTLGITDRNLAQIRESLRRWNREVGDDDRWSQLNSNAQRANRNIAAFNLTMGRAFGRGSRNNFVNFVGVVVRGLLDIARLPVMAIQSLSRFGQRFNEVFDESRAAGLGRFTSGFRGLSAAIGGPGGIIAALVGFVAILGVFGKLLPAIASAFSMVASVITMALGGALIGLTGWILALLPLIAAGAAGIAVLAGAIANMPEGTLDRLKAKFDGLKGTLSDIGERIAPRLETALSLVIDKVDGLAKNVGTSIVTILDDLNRRLASPQMDKFTAAWGQTIPRMVENLGIAFNALGEGLTAFFVPILPYAERLSEHIRDAFEAFSAWSQSAEGQNSIRNFMQDAWNTGQDLWDIILEIGEALGKIFYRGAIAEGTDGETFLEKVERRLRQFNDWLDSDEGKGAVKRWFEDGITFAENLYGVIEELGRIFDDLDSEEGRQALNDILNGIEDLLAIVEDVAAFTDAMSKLFDTIMFFSIFGSWDVGTRIAEELTRIREALLAFGDLSPERIGGWIITAFDWIAEKATWLWDLLFGNSIIPDIVNGFEEWFGKVPGIITGALSGVVELVAGPFRAIATAVADSLGQAKTNITTWASETKVRIQSWAIESASRVGQFVSTTRQNVSGWVADQRGRFSEWRSSTAASIRSWAIEQAARIGQFVSNTRTNISTWASNTRGTISGWVANVRGTLSGWKTSTESTFRTAWSNAQATTRGAAGGLQRGAASLVSAVARGLSGLYGTVEGIFSSAWRRAQGIWSSITSLASRARSAVSNLSVPWNASGNIYYGPTVVGVGEAGPEAIVPLNRPLSQVDPSVRALSAIAQGLAVPGVSTTTNNRGVTVESGAITVNAPGADPRRVAESVLDHIVEELAG